MRISDWSSDVCASDLARDPGNRRPGTRTGPGPAGPTTEVGGIAWLQFRRRRTGLARTGDESPCACYGGAGPDPGRRVMPAPAFHARAWALCLLLALGPMAGAVAQAPSADERPAWQRQAQAVTLTPDAPIGRPSGWARQYP